MSYDADFLHIARLQQKQQIDTVILSGLLTAWLLMHSFPLRPGQAVSREGDILLNCMRDFQNFSRGWVKVFCLQQTFMVMNCKFLQNVAGRKILRFPRIP